MHIYLADLGHNQVTATSDVYPLGVANLATYTDAFIQSTEKLNFTIFREPDELKIAIDRQVPDVLALSSYAWNHYLALEFARYAKAKNPALLTLMGGPNFPLTPAEQECWMREMPQIDIAVRGPTYEGERAFLYIIQRYLDVGQSIDGLMEEAVPGNLWIDKKTDEFVKGGVVQRIIDLDEIPSPYLAGYMDKFINSGYFAMLQIARGCPFTCQYCNSAVKDNNKIFRHSYENIKADMDYLVARINPDQPLCFADDNFGMYRQDEPVADYIGHLMDKHNWPRYIRTTTGKNQAERIIRVMRKVKGALPMTSAVQSLNPEVLKNIQRANISLDTFAKIQQEVQDQGMQAYGELILCMPGETKQSFMKAVNDLIETGVKRVSAHQLMLLHGAPLSNPDSREKFGFKTKFRVVARNIGDYTQNPVVETEEMVVETPTFSYQEYLECRVFHLLLTIYFYEGNFEEAFQFAREEGITPFELISQMQQTLQEAPQGFTDMVDAFVKESHEELFDDRVSCETWAYQHFDSLVDGGVGGNLLSKYSMMGRFLVLPEAMDFLHSTISGLIHPVEKDRKEKMLCTIIDYFRSVMLHVPFTQTIEETPYWTTYYDLDAWRDGHYKKPLQDFVYSSRQVFETTLDPSTKSLIATRIETFGEHPSGLGKFTRTMFAQDLRRKIVQKLH